MYVFLCFLFCNCNKHGNNNNNNNKRKENDRQTIEEKKGQKWLGGLTFYSFTDKLFFKATFTIWLLKNKGQLNNV